MKLLPTPVWFCVVSRRCYLLLLRTIREHGPNLFSTCAVGFKHYMPAIRSPRWKIVASGIMCELYPLFAGDVHNVDIRATGSARAIVADPGKQQELTAWRP